MGRFRYKRLPKRFNFSNRQGEFDIAASKAEIKVLSCLQKLSTFQIVLSTQFPLLKRLFIPKLKGISLSMGAKLSGNHHHHKGSNILVAFFLNAGFAIIELIGGYLTNSVAILSDAIHDFGDSIALLVAYFGEKVSLKDPDHKYTYGYRRFSVLTAAFSGLILFLGSIFVIKEAVERLASPEPVHAPGMIGFAILGIAVNGFAAFKLSKENGINQRMVMLHLFEDIIGWVAVLIVSIILLFKPWYILDSILSLMIALIILRGVYKQLKKIGAILLQKFPDDIEIEVLTEHIKEIESVIDVHAIQGWTLDGEINTLSFHVCIPSSTTMEEADQIKKKIKNYLETKGISYSSLEFESESYKCQN